MAARTCSADPVGTVDSFLSSLTASSCWAVVAAVHRRGVTTRYATGTADSATGARARPEHAFRMGSVTKTVVAAAALRAVADDAVRLDDTLGTLLPEVPASMRPVTLRRLLDHSSGIPDYTVHLTTSPVGICTAEGLRTFGPQCLLDVAAAQEPLFPPGSGWSYSNTNYLLVGLVLERVTGRPLHTLLRDLVLEPLGISEIWSPGTSPFMPAPHLHGYVTLQGRTRTRRFDVTVQNPSRAWASGDLIGTAAALERLFRGLSDPGFLPVGLRSELRRTVAAPHGREYGLGVFAVPHGTGRVWGYTGAYGGYLTVALADESGGSSVAMCLTPRRPEVREELISLAARLMDPRLRALPGWERGAPTGGEIPSS